MGRNRVRVSVTVDPDLLAAVDRFVGEHAEADRSKVFDEALSLWCAKQQVEGTKEQYRGEGAPTGEWEDWKAIQRAAYLYRLERDERR